MPGDTTERDVGREALPLPPRPARLLRNRLFASAAFLFLAVPDPQVRAQGAPIRAEVSGAVLDGFARLVFTMGEESQADARLSGGILIVAFKRPVNVSIEHLPVAAGGYVQAVRRDPDGTAVRLALARKVKVNTIVAGERIFVDLLPESWTGAPPPLPQEVVEELARRAREAEAKLRKQEEVARRRRTTDVRVRAAALPTLTRYVFEVPEALPVATEREATELRLLFEAPIKFDLADARAAMPPAVGGIEAELKDQSTSVRFLLAGAPDVRAFRDGASFVVDVSSPKTADVQAEAPAPAGKAEAAHHDAAGAAPSSPAKPADAGPSSERDGKAKPARPEPMSPGGSKTAAASPKGNSDAAVKPAQTVREGREPGSAADGTPAGSSSADSAAGAGVALFKPQKDALRIVLSFGETTPLAVFQRADTLWVVFDGPAPLDVSRLRDDPSKTIRGAALSRTDTGQALRLKLGRPAVASLSAEGKTWVITLGDPASDSSTPLSVMRTRTDAGQAGASITLAHPGKLHRVPDPELGDTLLVVTAEAPARGLPRLQDFVDFRALATSHGLAIASFADDLSVAISGSTVTIERPEGLSLTATANAAPSSPDGADYRSTPFDPHAWGYDRQAEPRGRESALMAKAAEPHESRRTEARFALARFYMAQERLPEAKGVLDVALSATHDDDLVAIGTVLRGVVNLLLGRDEQAIKDFSSSGLGNQHDARLWRGVALARMGRFAEARDGLKQADAVAGLPIELQRVVLLEAARAFLETGDLPQAARLIRELDGIGAGDKLAPALALMSGRVAEGLGRANDALNAYHRAAEATDQVFAAQGRLREVALRYAQKEIPREEAISTLEVLAAAWRGDETELETLQRLARFYTEDGRFREAFGLMRIALTAHPRSETTRRIQDEAGATFENVFLGDRGNALSPVEALGLFYDFRSLTPPGRRGDEMIRRLAERLVTMDLLRQAAELLQHQVDHRLQGIARAQIAARLATIYLMDRKAPQALKALHESRAAELPKELRKQRLLLEARALSDTGRPALALEITEGMDGREVERLRADVLWSAGRWQQAAEQIERIYGERWREFAPLEAVERVDLMRAAVAYALAGDALGSDRFRQRYAAKMADGPERRMFELVTAPLTAKGEEFRMIAKAASTFDTLSAFLRDMNARFPAGNDATSARAQEPRG